MFIGSFFSLAESADRHPAAAFRGGHGCIGGPLLHVAELHEECVEFGFGVHEWRVTAGIKGLSTIGHQSLCGALQSVRDASDVLGISQTFATL